MTLNRKVSTHEQRPKSRINMTLSKSVKIHTFLYSINHYRKKPKTESNVAYFPLLTLNCILVTLNELNLAFIAFKIMIDL